MRRFWVSWHQPTEDERPLTFPPNPAILGWWRSRYSCQHERDLPVVPILCALVEAENEDAVQVAVLHEWPEAETAIWRLFNEVAANWLPSVDRFPPSDWMLKRMEWGVLGSSI